MRKYFSLFGSIFFLILFTLPHFSFAQKQKVSVFSVQFHTQDALNQWIQSATYTADLPIPRMLPEPGFTQGRNNKIFWEIDYTPAADDSILLINILGTDETTGTVLPSAIQDFNKNYFPFSNLTPFHRYSFKARLVRQKKGAALPEVGDFSAVPSFSTQDDLPPVVSRISVPNANWFGNWTNTNSLQIQYTMADTSGIDSSYLFLRNSGSSGWMLFKTNDFDSVNVANFHFLTGHLADGYYEVSITGKDNSNAPESHGAGLQTASAWIADGNKGIPDTAQLKFHVDVTPPDTLTLTLRQDRDVIQIHWTMPVDPGIGLKGYKVYRDGQFLADISGTQTSYSDSLAKSMAALPETDAFLRYEVQPYDSLGNIQTKAVGAVFHFWAKPRMFSEPHYTEGTSNVVCWSPVGETDHYVLEWAADARFTVDVHSATPTDTCYTVQGLANQQRVYYRVKQVRSDGSETNWSNVVWSTQDLDPPVRHQFSIGEMDSSAYYHGWINQSVLHVRYAFSDSAGIDSVILWRIRLADSRWIRFLAKDSYDSSTVVSDTLIRTFPDGDYRFFVTARDHAHAPESHGNHLIVYGNSYQPLLSDQPLQRIKIDTTPPDSVTLAVRQEHEVIHLNWTASHDSSIGIGLAGYRILRNGSLIATVSAADTSFSDVFNPPLRSDQELHYQIQPFDSLTNVQMSGGTRSIWYRANPVMYAEPGATAGTQNQVCWKPKSDTEKYVVQVATDSLFQNQLATLNVQDTCVTKTMLENGKTYYYRVKQVRQDGSETGWSRAVHSRQDSDPPEITGVKIAEEDSADWQHGWYNRSKIHLLFSAADGSGLDSLFLYSRVDATTSWHLIQTVAHLDSIQTWASSFDSTLDDGWYEFFITGRDHAHAAISHEGKWFVLGNKYVPQSGDVPQAKVKIDTQPPSAVSASGKQVEDVIRLSWTSSQDAPLGIGLAGYRIIRNGQLLAEIPKDQTAYFDSLRNPPVVQTRYQYQIQPFDSLKNTQQTGGLVTVVYKPHPTMLTEPEITAGLKNVVCWYSMDDLDHFEVQRSENQAFEGKRDSVVTTDTCATFENLKNGQTYYYRVREIRKDGSMTGWSNTVWSTQDDTPPRMSDWSIAESGSPGWYHNWYSKPAVQIAYSASDSAGVDSVFLWKKNTLEGEWTVFDVQDYDSLAQVTSFFAETLPDGRYYFYLSGRDNAHAPQSRALALYPLGNKYEPTAQDAPQVKVFIDTTPPDTLHILSAAQTRGNRIEITWAGPAHDAGIGVAGIHVYKKNSLIKTLPASATSFRDTITASYSSIQTIHYRVAAFDSLNNENQEAGKRSVLFYPAVTAVIIYDEPEFTAGSSNEIVWKPIYLSATYTVQCSDDSTFSRVLQEKTTTDTSSVFSGLQDDVVYYYRVRAVDQFGRDVNWSAVTASRQDMSPPHLTSLTLPNVESIEGKNWIYGSPELVIRAELSDQKSGKVQALILYQDGVLQDTISFVAQHQIETSFSKMLTINPNTAVEICLRAVDAAGNVSEPLCKTIYWEPLREDIVAFPNPFDPSGGKPAIIRVKDAKVQEVWIYDYFGNLVRKLHKDSAGHDFFWDGRNGKGELVANGGYLCVIHGAKAYYKIAVLK
ncbi:MAG: hypothetical protein GXO76_07995 [Calditrichaeota bacterium]|nr:hypothetical protein [Calditrichota bacterium]